MGVTTTLDRVRRLVLSVADEVYRDGPQPGFVRAGYRLGVSALRDALLSEMDTGPNTDPADAGLYEAVTAYCYRRCVLGQDESPGGHPECVRCELYRYTVGRLRQSTDKAMEDPDGGEV